MLSTLSSASASSCDELISPDAVDGLSAKHTSTSRERGTELPHWWSFEGHVRAIRQAINDSYILLSLAEAQHSTVSAQEHDLWHRTCEIMETSMVLAGEVQTLYHSFGMLAEGVVDSPNDERESMWDSPRFVHATSMSPSTASTSPIASEKRTRDYAAEDAEERRARKQRKHARKERKDRERRHAAMAGARALDSLPGTEDAYIAPDAEAASTPLTTSRPGHSHTRPGLQPARNNRRKHTIPSVPMNTHIKWDSCGNQITIRLAGVLQI